MKTWFYVLKVRFLLWRRHGVIRLGGFEPFLVHPLGEVTCRQRALYAAKIVTNLCDEARTPSNLNRHPAAKTNAQVNAAAWLVAGLTLLFAFVMLREQKRRPRRLVVWAESTFSWIEVLLPRRVSREEIGDALELIHRIVATPSLSSPRLRIFLKVVTTVGCVVLNSIRYVSASIQGKKAE